MLFSVLWYAIFILGLQRLILFHTAIGIVVRCSVCDVNLMKHILHFLDVLVFSFHCVVSFDFVVFDLSLTNCVKKLLEESSSLGLMAEQRKDNFLYVDAFPKPWLHKRHRYQ